MVKTTAAIVSLNSRWCLLGVPLMLAAAVDVAAVTSVMSRC